MSTKSRAVASALGDVSAALVRAQDRNDKLTVALIDVLNAYEDERARIKAGNADRPSVSGQTFIDRARMLLADMT